MAGDCVALKSTTARPKTRTKRGMTLKSKSDHRSDYPLSEFVIFRTHNYGQRQYPIDREVCYARVI